MSGTQQSEKSGDSCVVKGVTERRLELSDQTNSDLSSVGVKFLEKESNQIVQGLQKLSLKRKGDGDVMDFVFKKLRRANKNPTTIQINKHERIVKDIQEVKLTSEVKLRGRRRRIIVKRKKT